MAGMIAEFVGLTIMLAVSSYTDIKWLEVEDKSILISGVACVGIALVRCVQSGDWSGLYFMLFGAVCSGIIGFVLFLGGMGFGDVKIMLVMGGYLGAGLFILALLFAALSGVVYGLIWKTLIHKKSIKDSMPFVPFLFIGSVIALNYNTFLGGLF